MSHNPPLSLEEQIAALDPQIKEAEEEIKELSRQLAGILEQLGGELISDARRADLMNERTLGPKAKQRRERGNATRRNQPKLVAGERCHDG